MFYPGEAGQGGGEGFPFYPGPNRPGGFISYPANGGQGGEGGAFFPGGQGMYLFLVFWTGLWHRVSPPSNLRLNKKRYCLKK